MRNRFVFYLLLIAILSALAWVGYRVYARTTAYINVQNSRQSVTVLRDLTRAISAIEREVTVGMVYLGRAGVNYLPEMKKARAQSDAALKKIDPGTLAVHTRSIAQNIQYARAAIDALTNDPTTILVTAYDRDVLAQLIHAIGQLKGTFATPALRQTLRVYVNMVRGETDRVLEKALLDYLQSRQRPVEDKSVALWEQLMGRLAAPDLSPLKDPALAKELTPLLWSQKNTQAVAKIRADVLYHLLDGKFTLSIADHDTAYQKIFDRAAQANQRLIRVMHAGTEGTIDRLKRELIQHGIAMLLLAVILFFLIRSYGRSTLERHALEETLREMVSDLDASRKEELEAVIQKGDMLSIYRFLHDTTQEAREAREQAIEAEKAKDLFLANMSHEIRTPLNGILGFTQLLESTELTNEQRGFIDIIKGSSDSLLTIVNSILDLSKIRAKKVELEAIPFSPAEVFSDAIEPLEVQASDKKIRYCSFVDPKLSMLIGDPTRLRQVLTNLIGNALKFTEAGGSIMVSITLVESYDHTAKIRFSIRDTGIGITPEQKEKIFDAFSQADSSTTRQFGGTGLGLAITSDLVKHMGCVLDVDSEPGKGSEFFFTLELEKSGEDEHLPYDLRNIRIAYYHPSEQHNRMCDGWVMRYLEEINPQAVELGSLPDDLAERFDVLFVDYTILKIRQQIDTILSLGIKVVPIGYLSYKDEIDQLGGQDVAIIYRPLSCIKIARALENLFHETQKTHTATHADTDGFDMAGLRVLVAEDNEINQNLIQAVLKNFDLDITLANNGEEAFAYRCEREFDLILMDIQMPVMGGIDATRAILEFEQNEGLAHVPIVALTANALQGDREKYLKVGMDDYVSKPIKIEQIRQVIQTHCRSTSGVEVPADTRQSAVEQPVMQPVAPETDPETEARPAPAPIDPVPETVSEPVQSVPDVPDTTEEMPKAPSVAKHTGSDILLFCRSGLVQNVHKHALTKEGFTVDIAETEEAFFDRFESGGYRYVLLDAKLIPDDNCVMTDVIRESGAVPMIYAMPEGHACAGDVAHYAMIEELREKLTV